MGKRLHLLYTCLLMFSFVSFGQKKIKKQPSGVESSILQQSSSKSVNYAEKNGEEYFVALDKSIMEFTPDKLMVKFHDNVSYSIKREILNQTGMFAKFSRKDVENFKQLSILDLKKSQSFSDLKKLKEDLLQDGAVKYVSYFYQGDDDTNQAPMSDVIVRLKSPSDYSILEKSVKRLGGKVLKKNQFKDYFFHIEAGPSMDYNSIKMAEALNATGKFKYAEPNFFMTNLTSNTNDPLVGDQWGLNNDAVNTAVWGGIADIDINAFEAWGITTGSSAIKIAVIDEGVDLDHPDLVDKMLPGFDATGGGNAGDAAGNDAHGTACSGIAAGSGDNTIGVAGVAYDCSIVPIRFLVGGSGSTADAVDAVLWAIDVANADILSNSWGGGGFSQALLDAFQNAQDNGRGGLGALSVVSSGNGDGDVQFPAAYDNVIAVGAMSMCAERKSPTSCDGEDFWGASFGPELDVVAPSPKIHATDIAGTSGYNGTDYTSTFNGTSASAPFAAGVLGLIFSANPTLTGPEAREILETSCRKLGTYDYQTTPGYPNGTWHEEVGHGMIDAFAAVTLSASGPQIIIDPISINSEVSEAQGCELASDVDLAITLLNDFTGAGTPTVTVNAVAGSEAVQGTDWDFIAGNTVSFSSAGTQTVGIRIYNDGAVENSESLGWEISLDPAGTDAVLSDNASFVATTWTILDSGPPSDVPNLGFVSVDDVEGGLIDCVNPNLTLSIVFDRFPQETTWEIVEDGTGVVAASGGPYPGQSEMSLDIPIALPDGDFTFTIFDQFSDGICCGFGNGFYTLESTDGTLILFSDGNFGASESVSFCTGSDLSLPRALALNGRAYEDPECSGAAFTDYVLRPNLDGCVQAEQDVSIEVQVDPSSTAVEGDDFTLSQTAYTFNGEDAESFDITLRVFSDGMMEGNETIVLNLVATTNGDLINIGENAMNTITIVDTDLPVVSFEKASAIVTEAVDYNCTDVSNTVQVGVKMDACPGTFTSDVVVSLVAGSGSVAESVDYEITSPEVTFTSMNNTETLFFEVVVFNDYLNEGSELLELDLQIADPSGAVLGAVPMQVTIVDALGNRAPGITEDLLSDFESGSFEGWIVTANTPGPNSYTIGENSGLDNLAAYISNDPDGAKPHTYSPTSGGNQIVFLLSPPFEMTDDATYLDFMYQVEGEPGFFGAFDFGTFGLVDGLIDPSDYNAILGTYAGNGQITLIGTPTPTTLSNQIGQYDIKADIGSPGVVRLAIAWVSDFSIQNDPPLAVDNISIDGATFIDFLVATNITPEGSKPEYPVVAGSTSYYYDIDRNEIIANIGGSSSDLGCTTTYIDREGTSASILVTDIEGEFAASKTYIVEPEMPSSSAEYTVSLYYTETELAGWEAATGKDRSELQMFKVEGSSVSAVRSDCVDFDDINFSPVTISDYPFQNGTYILTSTFTGIESVTGFGIAALPSLSPINFVGVQNKEQVDISWESAYSEANVSHYILQELFPDSNEIRELAIRSANAGSYVVTDFFPNNGLNQYRLLVVLNNGQVYTLCSDVSVRYDATSRLKVVPNPASDVATLVASDEDLRGVVGISLLDELGQVILQQDVISNSGVLRYDFDVSGLAGGMYFFRLDGEGESRVVSFVKIAE